MSTSTIPHSPSAKGSPSHAIPVGPAVPISRQQLMRLVRYLLLLGGSDTHAFSDHQGIPDYAAARVFAVALREQLGVFLDDLVAVEQRGGRVIVSTLLPSFV